MKRFVTALCAVLLLAAPLALAEEKAEEKAEKKDEKAATKRANIDSMAQETLDQLFEANELAKEFYDKAAGYAVLDNLKLAIIATGGGGVGVAVNKDSGSRTYMKMGTAGIGIGLGGQKYQVVFFFETDTVFDNFVEKGWQADASANAAAGTAGANAEANFRDGLAFYMLTEAGLMANADISGTK